MEFLNRYGLRVVDRFCCLGDVVDSGEGWGRAGRHVRGLNLESFCESYQREGCYLG